MGYFAADHEVLRERSGSLREVGINLREITQGVRMTAGRISQNPSLNRLQYPSMVREAGSVLESNAAKVEKLSVGLERVASLYESYENQIIRAPFEEGDDGVGGGRSSRNNPFLSFLTDGWESQGSLLAGKLAGSGEFLGIAASGAASGEILGWKAGVKADAAFDIFDEGEFAGNVFAGVKGEAEGYVLSGALSGDYGIAHGDLKGKVLSGAVEGELGASLFRDGVFDPALTVKGKAQASVLSGEAGARVGSEERNVHADAKGALFTAFAEGEAHVGKDGVKLKASGGAYAAQGEISGGINIMGLKIDVGAKGAAGGAGFEFGYETGEGVVAGRIGAGLGIGGGVFFKIDASGVPKAINDWWNSHFK